MFDLRLEKLKPLSGSYWGTRITSQIEYANELSKLAGGAHDGVVDQVITFLAVRSQLDGAITQETAQQAEKMLASLSNEAKSYRLLCAAHAHIDMNWMWRWDETVAITLDTFRTMLQLMDEYPQFKFSQSQASVYQIVETYAPEMLGEIRQRIKEGRWEVTAATWVEADKNLPNGESQARHLLLTRRYLSQLFDLKPEDFALDFEPDTFGHHANVPEMLASGGVKYYYHCRGDQTHSLYRWVAPSGKSILVYREQFWYLGYVEPSMALFVPAFCQQHGIQTALRVYGVGDHGGGPTRRDIERIIDMDRWPVFPTIEFGTFAEFYAEVEKVAGNLPKVKGELNFVFTGCYSSQSRIKKANRLAEAVLDSAERFCSLAALAGKSYPHEAFTKGWRNTLFNQFHDIIPGSGTADTRDYALGLFQETLALATSQKTEAFHNLIQPVNESHKNSELGRTIAEGAGVGFGIDDFKVSQVSRSGGTRRLFHVFNPSARRRTQLVEIVVWDWDGDLNRLTFQDAAGQAARHQLLGSGWDNYWGHNFTRVLVEVSAPPCGYTSLVLVETDARLDFITFPAEPRLETSESFRLENGQVCARFDPQSCALVSLVDKPSGEELVDPQRPAVFRIIQEDDRLGMTAWNVGRTMDVHSLVDDVRLLNFDSSGPLRQSLAYAVTTGASRLAVTVSLEAGSSQLEYSVEADWREVGRHGQGVPQLNFQLPTAYACRAYRYDIAFGTIERQPTSQDVPTNSWGVALRQADGGTRAIQVVTESCNAMRGVDNSLALTLIRSSYDPDPYPEVGIHKIRFAVGVVAAAAHNQDLITAAYDYSHPLEVFSGTGSQPTSRGFLSLESASAVLSAIKTPEDRTGDELVVRVYESEGQAAQVKIKFDRTIAQAYLVDLHEQLLNEGKQVEISGEDLEFKVDAYCVATVRVKFS